MNHELVTLLQGLQLAFDETDPTLACPIAMVLRSSNHAITVGYHPVTKQWSLIDANYLPVQYFSDTESLAEKIAKAFTNNHTLVFSTEIFTNKRDEEKLLRVIESWQHQATWQDIHLVTHAKNQSVDSDGGSWLYVATKNGQINTVKLLLENQFDPNVRLADGTTPLYQAVQQNNIDLIQALLTCQADVNSTRSDGSTPLYLATVEDNLTVMRMLLAKGANPNARSLKGASCLSIAAHYGNIEAVRTLLIHGADVNAITDTEGGYPLIFEAVIRGDLALTRLLLAYGADIHLKGVTLLHLAAQNNFPEITETLLAHGADANAIYNQFTPLKVAETKGNLAVVKVFHQHTLKNYIQQKNNLLKEKKFTLFGGRLFVSLDQKIAAAEALLKTLEQQITLKMLNEHERALSSDAELKSIYSSIKKTLK